MSAKSKRTLRAVLLGVFFDDAWRKLASVVLAFLLWQYLDRQVSEATTIEATMVSRSTSADLSLEEARTLVLRYEMQQYTSLGFENGRTGVPIQSVELLLAGQKHLVQAADQEAVFQVTLEPQSRGGRTIAEFDVTDLRAVSPRHQGLLKSMSPPKVLVHLSQNVARTIHVSRDRIEFVEPQGTTGFGQRLRWEDAQFDPPKVDIRGPASVVSKYEQPSFKIWTFSPPPPGPGTSEITAELRLAVSDPKIQLSTESVSIRVPLWTVPTEYTFEVPIVMWEPPELRDRFRLQRETAAVKVEVLRNLESRLAAMTPEERAKWAREHALIAVKLPPHAKDKDVVQGRLLIDDYTEGTDFRVTQPPTITYELRNG